MDRYYYYKAIYKDVKAVIVICVLRQGRQAWEAAIVSINRGTVDSYAVSTGKDLGVLGVKARAGK